MSKKPLTSLAGFGLACVMLMGCGHGAGYRRPNTGLGTPPPSNSAQARGPAKPSSTLPPLGGTTTGSQGSSIAPAALAPGSSNSSAGKPFQTGSSDGAFKLDQTPGVTPRQTVATSTGMAKPAAPVTAQPQFNSQGYTIPSLPSQDKAATDPSVRQTTVPMPSPMAPFREESGRLPSPPASGSQPAPSPDWPGDK